MDSPPVPFPAVKSPPCSWIGDEAVQQLGSIFLTVKKPWRPYLAHELGDHTVKAAALEVQRLASLANALLACKATSELPMFMYGNRARCSFFDLISSAVCGFIRSQA